MLKETDMSVQRLFEENMAIYVNKPYWQDPNHHLVHKGPLSWLKVIQGHN